jgi:hypothetical protein
MSKFTVTDLVSRLVSEFGYSPYAAAVTAKELVTAHPRVQEAFYHWWRTGKVTDLEVEGYNVRRLANERGMNPIAALLTLDWLLKEPKAALESLARKHDRIEW